MYNLPYFKEKDYEVIKDFMRQHPFAFLTGCDSRNRPVVTQIPVFIDEKPADTTSENESNNRLYLSGHMMRNTDHHKAFENNPHALAVFTGAHTYVSASWYENKKQGSTWNYISVHARGRLRFLGEQELVDVLRRTTNHFENNPHSGANFEDLTEDYVKRMIKAIVAFEIEVEEMDNVFKLSQNRDEKSFHTIVSKLDAQDDGGRSIAAEMKKRATQLYGKE